MGLLDDSADGAGALALSRALTKVCFRKWFKFFGMHFVFRILPFKILQIFVKYLFGSFQTLYLRPQDCSDQ